jgi:hypothetical protein
MKLSPLKPIQMATMNPYVLSQRRSFHHRGEFGGDPEGGIESRGYAKGSPVIGARLRSRQDPSVGPQARAPRRPGTLYPDGPGAMAARSGGAHALAHALDGAAGRGAAHGTKGFPCSSLYLIKKSTMAVFRTELNSTVGCIGFRESSSRGWRLAGRCAASSCLRFVRLRVQL